MGTRLIILYLFYSNSLEKLVRSLCLFTKGFCDWVKNIDGGQENNIKEDTIKELFVCAYEDGPARSAVQTMNLSRVPSELLEVRNRFSW